MPRFFVLGYQSQDTISVIFMLNQNTRSVQKSEAKLETPVSYLLMQWTKKCDISDRGQGLSCLQKYPIIKGQLLVPL